MAFVKNLCTNSYTDTCDMPPPPLTVKKDISGNIDVWRIGLKPPLFQVMEMEVVMEATRITMEETKAMEAVKITEEVDMFRQSELWK